MSEQKASPQSDNPSVHLADFDGPLDLLLHLIRKSEMDIYDIPIAEITRQYVDILNQEQERQIEVAGEYFVMAATLMKIKSEYLLPTNQVDDEGEVEEEEDPRDELVEQLLEYERYKKAASNLKEREETRAQEYTREATPVPKDLVSGKFSPGVGVDELQQAFAKVMARHHFSEESVETVQTDRVTVADRIDHVLEMVVDHPVSRRRYQGEPGGDLHGGLGTDPPPAGEG